MACCVWLCCVLLRGDSSVRVGDSLYGDIGWLVLLIVCSILFRVLGSGSQHITHTHTHTHDTLYPSLSLPLGSNMAGVGGWERPFQTTLLPYLSLSLSLSLPLYPSLPLSSLLSTLRFLSQSPWAVAPPVELYRWSLSPKRRRKRNRKRNGKKIMRKGEG